MRALLLCSFLLTSATAHAATAKTAAPTQKKKEGKATQLKRTLAKPFKKAFHPIRAWRREKQMEGEAKVFEGAAGKSTIIYLHGALESVDNELANRMVTQLRAAGVDNKIMLVPWEHRPEKFQRWLAKQPGRVILMGHSMGGRMINKGIKGESLDRRFAGKIEKSILLNPANRVEAAQRRPTLVIRGTEDPVKKPETAGLANVDVHVVANADHSLRFRPGAREAKHSKAEKDQIARSGETTGLNQAVARRIAAFLAE